MANGGRVRGGSYVFGIILIGLGVLFLISNLKPSFNPWPLLDRYWPVVFIVLGLAMLWDRMRMRNDPQARGGNWLTGGVVALVIVGTVVGVSIHKGGINNPVLHSTETVEKKGQSVTARIEMPAGELTIDGGSSHLLDADFAYDQASGKPQVVYTGLGTSGRLEITQHGGIHLGNNEDTWKLHFGDTPLELELEMGAGQGTLNLQGLDVARLKVDMGAGELIINLTGDRKRNLQADIHGGAGEATVHLPKNIGVEIHAEGGIGSIDTEGLRYRGGVYVNDAYGTSPISIRMNIEGGVGQIRLIQEH